MVKKKPVTIGKFDISKTSDPAANEDWIKTKENRASEKKLHDKLAKEHAGKQ